MTRLLSKTREMDWNRFAAALVVLIVLLVVAAVFLLSKPYRFEWEERSVVFYSSERPIMDELTRFSSLNGFLVTVHLREGGTINQHMANASNLFSVVLIGNSKPVTNLFVVENSEGVISSCQTNDGNTLVNRTLSLSDCQALRESFSMQGTIEVNLPNAKQSKAQILFLSNRLVLTPSNTDNLPIATYSALMKMFPNTAEILAAVNDLAGQVR